jgi:hypothetical protein
VCLQLASRAFCARGGEVREVKLELERARLEPYEGIVKKGIEVSVARILLPS